MGKNQTIEMQGRKIAEKYSQINKEKLFMQTKILGKKADQLKLIDPILVIPHEIISIHEQMKKNNIKPRIPDGKRLELMSLIEKSNEPYVIGNFGMISILKGVKEKPEHGGEKICTILEKEIEKNKDFSLLSVSEFIAWITVFGFYETNEILLPLNLSSGKNGKHRKIWDVIFWEKKKRINIDLVEKTIRQRNSCTMRIPFFKKKITLKGLEH